MAKDKAIDVMDALGSHIEIHSRGQEIFLYKPLDLKKTLMNHGLVITADFPMTA